jgi:Ca-activated chloride channel family protein
MVDVEVTGAKQIYPQTIPDLSRGEELVVAARLTKDATITVSGIVDGKKVTRTVDVQLPKEERRAWVGRMWAGSRVEHLLEEIALLGETEELTNEAIELSLAYNLVTPYTSFLAIPEEELTDSVAQTLADARAKKLKIQQAHKDALALSRDDMPPGDPVLTVHAPEDAQQVTAYFPFGLVKDLGWDAQEESWKVRFLVPNTVPDGVYQAKVVIVRADGTIEMAKATYTIDSTEPDFVVELSQEADGTKLRVTCTAGVAMVTVALVSDPQVRVTLVDLGGGVFEGVIAAPAGSELRVVAADSARNEADQLVSVL